MTMMTVQKYQNQLDELLDGMSIAQLHVSPDFLCNQTEGFPTVLCVLWDQGKAWIAIYEDLVMDRDETELNYYRSRCAEFGLRDCRSVSDFNALLEELGEEAYANGALHEPEEAYAYEESEEWDEAEEREARRVYHKIYLPEFVFEPYRKGQAPVCFSEFMTNEWSDEECRERYKAQLKGLEPGQQVR